MWAGLQPAAGSQLEPATGATRPILATAMTELQRMIGEGFRGATFRRRAWSRLSDDWTHDHCLICNAQIREDAEGGDFTEGFVTYMPTEPAETLIGAGSRFVPAPREDGHIEHWVCPTCFEKMCELCGWQVER